MAKKYDYTENGWDHISTATEHEKFAQKSSLVIHWMLKNKFKKIRFCHELKRYIKRNVNSSCKTDEEFQQTIIACFKENGVPVSFEPTTTKMSVFAKACVTKSTVSRKTVLLLGFGLNMSGDDVNMLLTKGIYEQEINPKDPFEVLCWYCYGLNNKNKYALFEKYFEHYNTLEAAEMSEKTRKRLFSTDNSGSVNGGVTSSLMMNMKIIKDEEELFNFLMMLKTSVKDSHFSMTARNKFQELYDEARAIRAYEENSYEASKDAGMSREWTYEDVSAMMIEEGLYDGIYDDNDNIKSEKLSDLYHLMPEKKLSRQRISKILKNQTEVCRTDLITLSFYIYSQQTGEVKKQKLFYEFCCFTDELLRECFMSELILQNPYENFILQCMNSDNPCETFSNVWKRSFKTNN